MKITRIYCEKLPSSVNVIGTIVRDVLGYIQECFGPLTECNLFELKVILNEIVLNAVKHGNLETKEKYIKIRAYGIDNGFVGFLVEDEGNGYDYEMLLSRNICEDEDCHFDVLEESGRGMLIVKALCDRIKINSRGNRIVVLKKLEHIQ